MEVEDDISLTGRAVTGLMSSALSLLSVLSPLIRRPHSRPERQTSLLHSEDRLQILCFTD